MIDCYLRWQVALVVGELTEELALPTATQSLPLTYLSLTMNYIHICTQSRISRLCSQQELVHRSTMSKHTVTVLQEMIIVTLPFHDL
jgi:hypothetical protein